MASLTGNEIRLTYPGLLKTTGNIALTAAEQVITDGLGNESTLSMGTSSASFTGNLDLSGATVTGLPGGTDTTYDLGAVVAAGNMNIALTGSDSSNDVVTLQAGTNITLTDNGSNNVTIDAAGGGGSAAPIVFTNGTIIQHTGPDSADTIIDSILIPGGTITGGEVIKFDCPLNDGPEGAFTYVSMHVSTGTAYDPSTGWFLGRQSSGGGPDGYHWQRVINITTGGSAHFLDTNGYFMPQFSADGVQSRIVDWTVDQYFNLAIFIEAGSGTWTGYSPSIQIYK